MICASALGCLARFEIGDARGSTSGSADTGGSEGAIGSAESGEAGGCAPGELACEGACVEPQTDASNCGACGVVCRTDETCELGECVAGCAGSCDPTLELCVADECVCRIDFVPCGGVCVDLASDPQHCGSCTTSCGVDACDEGDCQAESCQELTDCGGACVELAESPLHCGACGSACAGDELCLEGACVGYELVDCDSDLDCLAGVCCEIEGAELCLDGEQCP